MPYIDLRFHFTAEPDEFDEDYIDYDLTRVSVVGTQGIETEAFYGISERLVQSDDFYIETTAQITDAIASLGE